MLGWAVDKLELKGIRLAIGLTQADMARAIGISRVFLGLMERGEREISQRTAQAVRACRLRPLQKSSEESDPLLRSLELSLISAGIEYTVTHDEDIAEYTLEQSDVIIYASRQELPMITKDLKPGAKGILLAGKSAIDFACKLIEAGGALGLAKAKFARS